MRNLSLLFFTLLLTLVSGCASIVSDNESTTYIQTDPEHARCELHGQDFTRVVNTPSSISLPSEAAPITISCKADGYKNTVQEIDTSGDGWIVGNIIFGGIIGAVVDASRGAGEKYPPQYSMVLEPEQFDTLAELNAWYDVRVKTVEGKWASEIDKLEASCESNQNTTGISTQCKKLERRLDERDAELMEWEERRAKAIAERNAPAPEVETVPVAEPERTEDIADLKNG